MDNEEFYDSLEEEFVSASSMSLTLTEPTSETTATFEINHDHIGTIPFTDNNLETTEEPSNYRNSFSCKIELGEDHGENCDISSIVPLYGGDKIKTEIEVAKNGSSSSLPNHTKCEKLPTAESAFIGKFVCSHKRRSIFTTQKSSQSSCTDIEKLVKTRITKSYLDMFHARMGCGAGFRKGEIEDSVRSLFGDSERSLISDVTDREVFKGEDDKDSDTLSFYFGQMQSDYKNNSSYNLNQTTNSSTTGSISPLKLNSHSELFGKPVPEKLLPKPKPRSKRTNVVPIPVLGGLGPNITGVQDKLERRRMQLSYGQKASNRNRIKLMEMKVLKNLKEEIQQSNSK